MDIKELFGEIEEKIIKENLELNELNNKTAFLSQLLPNTEKLLQILESSVTLHGLVYAKKRKFFFEAVEIFNNFHNLADSTRDTAYDGLLNILDNIEEDCIYKDKNYEMEKKAHLAKVGNYENQLSEVEKKIFSEIDNAENLYYKIYSNLLFETMLIVSRLLNSVERTKKIDF